MSNTAIWDKLGKTDPSHTKGFNRSGGFKGTAIKPQWVIQRLTEQFGPCGLGWGVNEPSFQTVHVGTEVMVYCTVSAWYRYDSVQSTVWGVGGDKVAASRSSGVFTDDEAFKKSFTDAIMNAFKFIGVGADVHMGRFDDSKYVAEVSAEFAAAAPSVSATQAEEIKTLLKDTATDEGRFLAYFQSESVEAIPASKYGAAVQALKAKAKK